MRIGLLALSFSLTSILGVTAAKADVDSDFLESLPKIAPNPGRAKATAQRPPWCAGIKRGSESRDSIYRTLESAERGGWNYVMKAAVLACYYAADAPVRQATAMITQYWINQTGMNEAEAIASITARINEDTFMAAKKSLCTAIKVDPEADEETDAYGKARNILFGCDKADEPYSMWATGTSLPDMLTYFLDAKLSPTDDLVRLAYVVDHVRYAPNEKTEYWYQTLLSYGVDQIDFEVVGAAKPLAGLTGAPYEGNIYAKTVVVESAAWAKAGLITLADEVGKKSKDDGWKELLATAPQRGAADYAKAMAASKDAVSHSDEFERTFWRKRSATKGCWATLRKEFVTVAKTLDHSSEKRFVEAMSSPVPSLLFSRLAACAQVDGAKTYGARATSTSYATRLINVARTLRFTAGPRTAAYYATLEALPKILVDRPKFPITAEQLGRLGRSGTRAPILDAAYDGRTHLDFIDNDKGVVKSTKKVPLGIEVTFVTTGYSEPTYNCTTTNRIRRIDSQGNLEYYENCVATGKQRNVNTTTKPMIVPSDWAAGIVANTYVEFEATPEDKRVGLPHAVYKDKTMKQLVAYMGIGI